MSKAGSTSQVSNLINRATRSSATPSSAPPSVRRRPVRAGGGGKMSQSMMNFYTDDSPGLKISPVAVIVMSLGYIGFVTMLHIIGKLRGV